MTRQNERLIMNIAWNYGGRDEIIAAVQHIIQDGIDPDNVTEPLFNQYLMTFPSPDPDLVIRTSGEQRSSNFLLWQSAYSELYFAPTLWPDFGKEQLKEAIIAFGKRSRRFGGRKNKDNKKPYAG